MCPDIVSRHCVPTLCPYIVSRHCVSVLFPDVVSRHCVPTLCPNFVSRHCVPTLCPDIVSQYCVTSITSVARDYRCWPCFLIRHKLASKYLLPNSKCVSDAHNHFTRGSSCNFHLSRNLSLSPNGFSFTAISPWNALSNSLKSIDNFRVFKYKLKQYLLAQYG